MLTRLLITWLMMTIFGYGMALAVDIHNVQLPELAHSMDLHAAADQSSHADHDDSPRHDHCYHGSSHLVGLNSALYIDFMLELESGQFFYSESPVSSPPSRFLRPPKQT